MNVSQRLNVKKDLNCGQKIKFSGPRIAPEKPDILTGLPLKNTSSVSGGVYTAK
jgi:hypothetical protein